MGAEYEHKRENAVIYARFSSSGQREESIEGQIRECKAFAERFGLKVIGEYCDHAISGTSDKRPEFQRMIRDSAKGLFTVIITWKNDRFARSRYDSAIYKYKLKQNGVRLLYARESIPDGPEGIILESVMEGYAEYYSANLSQNVKRGLYDSARKLQTLGQTLYGLRKAPDGRYEIDPETAPVVKRIFDEYAAGKPAVEIYRSLNDAGYRTRTGGLFNKSSLRRILKNQKYCGIYEYADIRVEDGIPAIVSKETFEKVQKMIDLHHEKPAAQKIDGGFLLTGKLFCGHCGEPMTGDGGTSATGRVYQYYTCNNRRRKKCDKKRAPKSWIEDIVVKKLMEIAADDHIIQAFADRFMEWQRGEEKKSELHALESKLKQVKTAIQNTMAVIDSGVITESLKSHLLELEAERSALEIEVSKARIADPILERDQIVYFLKSFQDGDDTDPEWRIFLVDTFLKAAYLYDNGDLLLCLNFKGDSSKVTLKLAEEAVVSGEAICSDFAPCCQPKAFVFVTKVFLFAQVLVGIGLRDTLLASSIAQVVANRIAIR